MSIGLATPACGGRKRAQRGERLRGQLGKRQAAGPRRRRRAGCRGRRRWSPRRRAARAGPAAWRSSAATSNSSSQRVGADDAGLLEERVDGDVEARQRRRVARRGARAGRRAARLDGDDRLAARDLGRDAGELARVPEALEVEDDHRGARVVGPVAEQIVARDVGLVADRDERRDADVRARGRSRGWRARARRSARACRCSRPAARSARRSRSARRRGRC